MDIQTVEILFLLPQKKERKNYNNNTNMKEKTTTTITIGIKKINKLNKIFMASLLSVFVEFELI